MPPVFSLDSIACQFQPGDSHKRPFLFVHGNTQNDTCGKGLRAFFAERGHSVLSYDLPGHGDSPLDTTEYQFTDLIDLNHQVIQHFQLEKPILCGHSLGAMIQAGTVAAKQIAEASLIFCGGYDASPMHAAKSQGQEEAAKQVDHSLSIYITEGFKLFKRQSKYDYFKNRAMEDGILQIINLRYTQPQASKINLQTLGEFSARQELVKLNVPLLVLHGDLEEVIPKPMVETMLAAYPDCRVEWYPEHGHCAFYQAPELTDEFLSKHYDYLCQTGTEA